MSLKDIRKSKKITQEQLSKMIGVSQQSISFYEKGTKKPSYKIIVKMSKALCCSVSEIFDSLS